MPTVTLRSTTAGAGTKYVRIQHDGVGPADWRDPYRLTVTESTVPDLVVTLTPTSPVPVVIGRGERVFFDVTFEVSPNGPGAFEYWSEARLPNRTTRSPLIGPNTVFATPPASVTLSLSQLVPNGAPIGDYIYTVNAGTYPGTVHASDELSATVVDGVISASVTEWLAYRSDGSLLAPGTVHDLRGEPAASSAEKSAATMSLEANFPQSIHAHHDDSLSPGARWAGPARRIRSARPTHSGAGRQGADSW